MSKFFRQMNSLRERDDKERKSRLELVKVGVTPTVVVPPTGTFSPTEQEEAATPTVGETQPKIDVSHTPITVGVAPAVMQPVQTEAPDNAEVSSADFIPVSAKLLATVTPPGGVTPTVGVTVQKTSYSKGLPPSQISSQWVSLSSGKCYPANRVLRVDIAQTSLGL